MEITRQADYAVRAVLDLATHQHETFVLSDDIAHRQGVPRAFLTKILARLAAAGLLDTQRGVNGGVALALPAKEISLLQVIEIIDGPITLSRCIRAPGECARDLSCPVHPVWAGLRDRLRDWMADIDFESLTWPVGARSGSPLEWFGEDP